VKVVHQKRKDRPRKQRIKSFLRRVAEENCIKIIHLAPLTGLLVLDLLDDGAMNFSILGGFQNV